MKRGKNKNKSHFWLISIIVLCLGFSFSCKKIDKVSDKQEEAKPDLSQIDDTQGRETSSYQPQHSKDNPRKESLDPFTKHHDFEIMLSSNKNKTDFDFDFPAYADELVYFNKNRVVDFVLKGKLQTITDLANIPLSLIFYNNNQISFTKREAINTFDIAFIKETKKATDDKFLYRFDFETQIQLDKGLHYFLIIPTGRNRVLYTGKFLVK